MTYTVETPEGEFLFKAASSDIIAALLNLHAEAIVRMIEECRENKVCILQASRPYILSHPCVHVWATPPWRRLLTEEQQEHMLEINTECVRDDPQSFAEEWNDEMSTQEIQEWLKEYEEDAEALDDANSTAT